MAVAQTVPMEMQPADAANKRPDVPAQLVREDRERPDRVLDHLGALARRRIVAVDLEIANHLDAERDLVPARDRNAVSLGVAQNPDVIGADYEMRPRVPAHALIVVVEPRAPPLLGRRAIGEPLRKRGNASVVQRRKFRAPPFVPGKAINKLAEFVPRVVARVGEIAHIRSSASELQKKVGQHPGLVGVARRIAVETVEHLAERVRLRP